MIDKGQFDILLPAITSTVFHMIVEKRDIPENEALGLFLSSEVYSLLEDSKTGIWHYSPLMLMSLLEDEEAGHLEIPDVI